MTNTAEATHRPRGLPREPRACALCGSIPTRSRQLCSRCYQRWYRRANHEREQAEAAAGRRMELHEVALDLEYAAHSIMGTEPPPPPIFEREQERIRRARDRRDERERQAREYAARAVQMLAEWERGDTLRVIAERYGISGERVRQIVSREWLERYGYECPSRIQMAQERAQVKRERARAKRERARVERERVYEFIAELWRDGLTVREIADELGLTINEARGRFDWMRKMGYDLPFRRSDKVAR